MTSPSVDVQLAEIRGELGQIATKLEAGDKASEHLFALLKEQLSYFRGALDDLKSTLQSDRDRADRTSTAVRMDLESQVGEVATDLTAHVTAKNPHPVQEEWLRANCRTLADEVGKLRDDHDSRLKSLEHKVATEAGAREGRRPVTTFAWAVLTGLMTSLATAGVFLTFGL